MAKRGIKGHDEPLRFYSMRTLGRYSVQGEKGDKKDKIRTAVWGSRDFIKGEFQGIPVYIPVGDETGIVEDHGQGDIDPDSMIHDLLSIDPRVAEELEPFMHRYGLVRSLSREQYPMCSIGSYDMGCVSCNAVPDKRLTGISSSVFIRSREYEGISETRRVYDLANEHADKEHNKYSSGYSESCVSVREAKEAAFTVRTVISIILDAKKEGHFPDYEGDDTSDADRLFAACAYASAAIAPYTPIISPYFGFYPAYAPTLAVALSRAIDIALDMEPLKQCKQCGRWFQYRKAGMRSYPVQNPSAPTRKRERGSDFCSYECYKANNRDRTYAKRAEERAKKAAKGDSD